MLQLYFLSIMCNGIAGYLFAYGDAYENRSVEDGLKSPTFGGGFRLIVGLVSVITGFLKLLLPVRVPILGDLFPAVVGIAAGFILLYEFYSDHGSRSSGEGKLERIGDVLLKHKKPMGFVCMAAAVLHFLFPRALFL